MKRTIMIWLVVLTCVVLTTTGWCEGTVARGTTSEARPTAVELRARIDQLMLEREQVLRELAARYQAAPLDRRVVFEAESARLQQEYEHRYLELVVEWATAAGNTVELQRAQEMLRALDAERADEPSGSTLEKGGTR
jgi:hypothetical protein